jgi:hypothetical protein
MAVHGMESLELPCKNLKRSPSSGEVMAAVFWDMRGIFVDVMKEGTTIKSEAYATTCKDSRRALTF